MSEGNWKKHLLRSGLPLEFEVARILAKLEMSVSADFCFMRRDGLSSKESSVDIAAEWYDRDDPNFCLNLLIECKHRSRDKALLFLPDPNEVFSPVTLGGTIHPFDYAVPYTIALNSFVELERKYEFVYKGIDISDAGAMEEQIWHGVQQLRYGVPVHLRKELEFNLCSRLEEALAQFFACILVTNAQISVLKHECTISDIEAAKTLEEISTKHECVILYSDYGPDFADHVRSVFSGACEDFKQAAKMTRSELVELGKIMNELNDPVEMLSDFENAVRYPTMRMSTQFFVVTLNGLEALLRQIMEACLQAYAKREFPKGQAVP